MGWFLTVIGIIWSVKGVILILIPEKVKIWQTKLLNVKDPRLFGLIPLVVGILLFFASPWSRLKLLIILLGILFLIKGLFIFLVSLTKIKYYLNWWMNLSISVYKICGIIILVLGVVVICTSM